MKTTLKKLSIPKPKGGFDELYLDDFATTEDLIAEFIELEKLVYKLHFEKDEVTDIHPFYIKSLEDENVIYDSTVTCRLSTHASDVEYSYGDSWVSLSDVETISLDKGERVYFRYVGENYLSGVAENTEQSRLTTTTKTFDVGGDIRTLIFGNTTEESVQKRGMEFLFYNSNVVDASKLLLNATTLASYCYSNMFSGCTGLTQAPEVLPATTLANQCYGGMFNNCAALTQAPELPATTLADYCYMYMFYGCTSLTQAPALPATTLASACYGNMFSGCTGLTQAPELPATTLASGCYEYMFNSCTGLTQAPALPATTLASGCYSYMFCGCNSLIQAPELPATTLAGYCYFLMFQGCTALTQAPELPATTLESSCYYGMFYGCTGLTQAPVLPATTLANSCYQWMFSGCSNLNYIKCLATNISATYNTTDWVNGVSSTGTFVKDVDTSWTTGSSGIPEGWIVKDNVVTFTAEEENSTIGLTKLSTNQTLEYRTENSGWTNMTTSTNITLNNVGDKVYMRGVLSENNSDSNYTQFTMTGKIAASGNCNALWSKDDLYATLKAHCGHYMFFGCTDLTQAPELPATKLASYCYAYMFRGCTSLTKAPELPATTLAYYCYGSMFDGCTALTQAPDLPATTLSDQCYDSMFWDCTGLTQAPALPATTLASACYGNMFSGCTGLTQVPELPVTTLADYCYQYMFSGCTGLTQAPELPATTLADYCYRYMFYGCTGLTQSPELPATKLTTCCYEYMFYGCSNLNYIKCLATDISATDCTNFWVSGVASTGTFVKNVFANWETGVNGIPEGWTSENN